MSEDMQVIWSLDGNGEYLFDTLGIGPREDAPLDAEDAVEYPLVHLHVGEGTFQEAEGESLDLNFLLAPDDIHEPILALCNEHVFGHADIYPTVSSSLLVSEAFVEAFQDDLESCRVYGAVGVFSDGFWWGSTREELLRAQVTAPGLSVINPLTLISTPRPLISEDLLFVPGVEELPAFFRVPWRRGAVFVRDDVRLKIERLGLRGAEFNLAPWPVG